MLGRVYPPDRRSNRTPDESSASTSSWRVRASPRTGASDDRIGGTRADKLDSWRRAGPNARDEERSGSATSHMQPLPSRVSPLAGGSRWASAVNDPPKDALDHIDTMLQKVRLPVSTSRYATAPKAQTATRSARVPDKIKRPALGGRSQWATDDDDTDDTVIHLPSLETSSETKESETETETHATTPEVPPPIETKIEGPKTEAMSAPDTPESATAANPAEAPDPVSAQLPADQVAESTLESKAVPSISTSNTAADPVAIPIEAFADAKSIPLTTSTTTEQSGPPSLPHAPPSQVEHHIDWADDDEDDALPDLDEWLEPPAPKPDLPAAPAASDEDANELAGLSAASAVAIPTPFTETVQKVEPKAEQPVKIDSSAPPAISQTLQEQPSRSNVSGWGTPVSASQSPPAPRDPNPLQRREFERGTVPPNRESAWARAPPIAPVTNQASNLVPRERALARGPQSEAAKRWASSSSMSTSPPPSSSAASAFTAPASDSTLASGAWSRHQGPATTTTTTTSSPSSGHPLARSPPSEAPEGSISVSGWRSGSGVASTPPPARPYAESTTISARQAGSRPGVGAGNANGTVLFSRLTGMSPRTNVASRSVKFGAPNEARDIHSPQAPPPPPSQLQPAVVNGFATAPLSVQAPAPVTSPVSASTPTPAPAPASAPAPAPAPVPTSYEIPTADAKGWW